MWSKSPKTSTNLKRQLSMSVIALCLFLTACALSKTRSKRDQKDVLQQQEPRVDFLWRHVMREMLQGPLWKKRDAYDAGHFLMIPLHAAFGSENASRIKDFHNFSEGFKKNHIQDGFNTLNTLTRLHFLYIVSQYLVLSKSHGGALDGELTSYMINYLESIWNQPAWQWDRSPFPEGMAQRIQWKLQSKNPTRSYYRAIIDEEVFTFAIAADLKSVLLDQSPKFIDEILDISYKVFKQEVVFLDAKSQRWLLQPGVWTDHPDYAYAGCDKITPNLNKKPVPEIAWDSSHFFRFPLWLLSLQGGFIARGEMEKAEYFEELRRGLTVQFLKKVLIAPSKEFPNYRTTNFMDGHNGVFRYNYPTAGPGQGYGPYELSGTILIGWWIFLKDQSIQDVYCFIASHYPLSEKEIDIYLGPDTNRDRHPFIEGQAQYKTGLLELIDRLACSLEIY